MSLEEFLARAQGDVDRHLQYCIERLPADRVRDAMAYSLFNGGKRVRPALCYAAGEVFAPATDLTHSASAAVELIHAYSLIHDDLPAMDDDKLRRGKPTCHIAFDEATAILAGDALQTLAFELLSEPRAGRAERQLRMIGVLADASGASGMVLGQSRDMAAANRSIGLDSLEAMHRCKTGALIQAAITLGAMASCGADEADLEALATFGAAVGLAFQVKDDILDVESSTAVLGKTQGADRAHNKSTYTSLLGLDGAKAKLGELHASALAATARFGERGATLRAIADFIVHRGH